MQKKITVKKEDKEYEVTADGDGVVWLDSGEVVVSNPEGLRFHSPRQDGRSQLEANASVVCFIAFAFIVFFVFFFFAFTI